MTAESRLAASSRRYWSDKSDGMHRGSDETAYAKYAKELLALLPTGGTLVDVGCGALQVTSYLAPHFARVVGFDRSETMLAAAAARVARFGLDNVELRAGDAAAFPPGLPSADVVLSYGVVQYLSVEELGAHLRECRRTLAAGGTACSAIVPDAALRSAYYYGRLVPAGPRFSGRLRSYVELNRRRLKGRLAGNPLWDGMGNWFSVPQFEALARQAGFDAEFRHCWFYDYRFHALLRPALVTAGDGR
jgi:SAM-dependent methyltransferase